MSLLHTHYHIMAPAIVWVHRVPFIIITHFLSAFRFRSRLVDKIMHNMRLCVSCIFARLAVSANLFVKISSFDWPVIIITGVHRLFVNVVNRLWITLKRTMAVIWYLSISIQNCILRFHKSTIFMQLVQHSSVSYPLIILVKLIMVRKEYFCSFVH